QADKAALATEKARGDSITKQLMVTQEQLDSKVAESKHFEDLSAQLQDKLNAQPPPPSEGPNNNGTSGLFWNAWTEKSGKNPSFDPVLTLRPDGKEYVVNVNLSSLRYDTRYGTAFSAVGSEAQDWFKKQDFETTIDILMFCDDAFISLDAGGI